MISLSKERHRPNLPGGWTHHVHAEGQCYFVRSEPRETGTVQYITDLYLFDRRRLEEVESMRSKVQALITQFEKFPPNCQVVIRPRFEGLSYYMVDTDRCRVFWLHPYDAKYHLEIHQLYCRSHLGMSPSNQHVLRFTQSIQISSSRSNTGRTANSTHT